LAILDRSAYWKNAPAPVRGFTIGGYQVNARPSPGTRLRFHIRHSVWRTTAYSSFHRDEKIYNRDPSAEGRCNLHAVHWPRADASQEPHSMCGLSTSQARLPFTTAPAIGEPK
jgi:hypothetical protein